MFRILRILILVVLAYSIVTATSTQKEDMIRGVLAIKDAVVQGCQREGGLCTLALDKLRTSLFSNPSVPVPDQGAPQEPSRSQ